MERQLPKNVRQIGNVSDSPKIYVEDYVDTFFAGLCEKCEKAGTDPMGAFLSEIFKTARMKIMFIFMVRFRCMI